MADGADAGGGGAPAQPPPQRLTSSLIHQKAEGGELLWIKAALDAGADIHDRGGMVRAPRAPGPGVRAVLRAGGVARGARHA
jgi:hypothetical protein